MIDRFEAQMQALQMLSKAQEVAADNMANINTPGFKGSIFYQRLVELSGEGETEAPVAMQQISLEQGVLEATGNQLDFGIDGNGFFVVQEGEESLLTRDGRFHVDPDGYLVNDQGAQVLGHGGPIHIPEFFHAMDGSGGEANLEVATDGTLRLNNEVYDQLQLVEVEDPSELRRRGNSYYAADNIRLSGEDSDTRVMQGFYEKGNVDPLQEMVSMMRTMQMFEAQQRAMRSTDEALGQATSSLARL